MELREELGVEMIMLYLILKDKWNLIKNYRSHYLILSMKILYPKYFKNYEIGFYRNHYSFFMIFIIIFLTKFHNLYKIKNKIIIKFKFNNFILFI